MQTKTEEVRELNKNRDYARLALKRGKREYERNLDSYLAEEYASGTLDVQCIQAEQAYGDRKTSGVAVFMGARMGD